MKVELQLSLSIFSLFYSFEDILDHIVEVVYSTFLQL